jgi:hypothetical protein
MMCSKTFPSSLHRKYQIFSFDICKNVYFSPNSSVSSRPLVQGSGPAAYTDKKENKIFLIYKEIKKVALANSYMTNGLLINGEIFAHFPIPYIRKPFLIYDFATASFFISVRGRWSKPTF